MSDWHEVRSTGKNAPSTLDTTSSKAVVYERRNIRKEQREVQHGDKTRTVTEWVYEQREYTAEEYAAMVSPAIQSIMQAISGLELSVAMMQM